VKPAPTTRRGRAARAVRTKTAAAVKDVKATGRDLRGERRDPETARRAHRDAHRGPVAGAVPGTYARRPPPVAPDRARKPQHHERPMRDVTPTGRAMDEDVLARRGGDKPWSRAAALDRAIAAERGPRPADVTAQPAPSAARDNWQARMDRARTGGRMNDAERAARYPEAHAEHQADQRRSVERRARVQGGAVPGQQRGPARGSGGGEIQSMKSDFQPRLRRAEEKVDEAIDELRRAAADIEDTPSSQAVKDAANALADQLQRPRDQIGEVYSTSRQADAPYWELAEDSRPNKQAWTQD
jgi:hypothetical protein